MKKHFVFSMFSIFLLISIFRVQLLAIQFIAVRAAAGGFGHVGGTHTFPNGGEQTQELEILALCQTLLGEPIEDVSSLPKDLKNKYLYCLEITGQLGGRP